MPKPRGAELNEKKGDEPVVDLVKTVRTKNNIPQSCFCECEDVPKELWDTEDTGWLNKVHCHAEFRLTYMDQNLGTFNGTVRFTFLVRTPKGEEALVPDVRMPALSTTMLEKNRSFKQAETKNRHSTLWKGLCSYSFSGFEIFEVRDFPYDRQLLNMGLLHFVWRRNDEHDDFHGMEMVSVSVKTASLMPEWHVFRACLEAKNSKCELGGLTKASRFELRLRLQRQPTYYILNIFTVTVGITVMSMCGLLVDPEFLRLSLYAAGLLTLVAFKYSINESLPNVAYLTLVDKVLLAQMFTHILLSGEAAAASILLAREAVAKDPFMDTEYIGMGGLVMLWLAILIYVSCGRGRTDWETIWKTQEGDSQELED